MSSFIQIGYSDGTICITVKIPRTKRFPLIQLCCAVTFIVIVGVWCHVPSTNTQIRSTSYLDPMSLDTWSRAEDHLKAGIDMSNTDPMTCANAFSSVMKLVSPKNEFLLGDTIQVGIQLFDSYKKRKTRGGDFVRVLMREDSNGASAAGSVTDNNDGTYTGSLKALWTGSPQIEAVVVGSRETMDIYKRMYHEHHTLRYFNALFEREGVKEETGCLPVPQVPGFRYVCNLTAENYGLPWYCGKPSHRKLLCHDFRGLSSSSEGTPHLIPHEERFIDKQLLHQKIPGLLQIKVISDKAIVPLPSIPCNKSPLRQSWEASSPVGFFYKHQWKSLTCNNTIPPDPQIYWRCLKDRTLWLHGDSTTRHWFVNFKDRLRMELVTETGWWFQGVKWHNPAVLSSEERNTRIFFVPHEYPFYHNDETRTLALNRATHTYLDEIPSHSRDIFVIHLYLHFLPSSPELFRSHVRRVVKSVKSLVSRAPHIKLAVRGTHAFKGLSVIGFLDDIWMLTFDRILKEEFRDVQDKVLFLNNEDLTIVTEIDDPHPTPTAVTSLIEHFMGSVCD